MRSLKILRIKEICVPESKLCDSLSLSLRVYVCVCTRAYLLFYFYEVERLLKKKGKQSANVCVLFKIRDACTRANGAK